MPGNYMRINCASAFEELQNIRTFLINTVGWVLVETITDTSSILDIVLTSVGESDVPNGLPIFIRLRNTVDRIFMYTYETYTDSVTNTGEVTHAVNGAVTCPTALQGYEVIVVADLERVMINNITYNGASLYMGYVGRITAYHRANEHNYPNIVKGGVSASTTWYYSASEINSYMLGPDGTQQHYHAIEPLNGTGLTSGESSDRDASMVLSAPVLVNVDADPQKSELVGEPRGVYRVSERASSTMSFIRIEGQVYVVVAYLTLRMALGPIGNSIPPLLTSI